MSIDRSGRAVRVVVGAVGAGGGVPLLGGLEPAILGRRPIVLGLPGADLEQWHVRNANLWRMLQIRAGAGTPESIVALSSVETLAGAESNQAFAVLSDVFACTGPNASIASAAAAARALMRLAAHSDPEVRCMAVDVFHDLLLPGATRCDQAFVYLERLAASGSREAIMALERLLLLEDETSQRAGEILGRLVLVLERQVVGDNAELATVVLRVLVSLSATELLPQSQVAYEAILRVILVLERQAVASRGPLALPRCEMLANIATSWLDDGLFSEEPILALERIVGGGNREAADSAEGFLFVEIIRRLVAMANGGGLAEAAELLDRLAANPNPRFDEAIQRAQELYREAAGQLQDEEGPFHEPDPTPEAARDLLRGELGRFAGGAVCFERLLRPVEELEAWQLFAPKENLRLVEMWEGYRLKLLEVVNNLPLALVRNEEERESLRKALVSGGQPGAYPKAWFKKIMETAEARSQAGREAVRAQVATAINYLRQLQERGRHVDVYRILGDLRLYVDACPDRASFGVSVLNLQCRILMRIGDEADADRRALLMADELMQQLKLNFVRTTLMPPHGGAGEVFEGYLVQCLRFREVLGLPLMMNAMLYEDLGRQFVRGDFGGDLRRVLEQLSQAENLVSFVATPPEDSLLSGVPKWEMVSHAPRCRLLGANEGERSRLLCELVTPMLQSLGFIKGPSLEELRGQAMVGDGRAITVLYWMALAGQDEARAILQRIPLGPALASNVDVCGLLAKIGHEEAKAVLRGKVGALRTELASLCEEADLRREEILNELTQIGGYEIAEAVAVLEGASWVDSLWSLAKRGGVGAMAAIRRLLEAGNGDARAMVNAARRDGDPLALALVG